MDKVWTIKKIEAVTEKVIASMAEELVNIKEHDVYLVDFKGGFGYSAVVFYNGYHIRFANLYQLHYPCKTKEELRTRYLEILNHKLFTEDEMETVIDYNDFKAKEEFLRSYYSQRKTYISIFFCGDDKEREKRRKKTEKMYYDDVCFAYFYDKEFVMHHKQLFNTLLSARDKKNEDLEYWVKAFKHEMYNHEYAVAWDADESVLSAFGNVPYKRSGWTLDELLDEICSTPIQKKAYYTARKEYLKESRELY